MKIFDLDNTITPSRQKIQPHVKKVFLEKVENPFMVISGLPRHEMETNLDGLPAIIMAQQGNDAPDWQNTLTEEEINEVKKYVEKFKEYWEPFNDKQEVLQNRGGLVCFSFTGHFAPQHYKDSFDPNKYFRKWILTRFPFKSETLIVGISGTTTLDFTRKDWKKGNNIQKYLELHNINPDDCVYYGDSLSPEGNDYSVLGIVKCVEVKNPDDLITKL